MDGIDRFANTCANARPGRGDSAFCRGAELAAAPGCLLALDPSWARVPPEAAGDGSEVPLSQSDPRLRALIEDERFTEVAAHADSLIAAAGAPGQADSTARARALDLRMEAQWRPHKRVGAEWIERAMEAARLNERLHGAGSPGVIPSLVNLTRMLDSRWRRAEARDTAERAVAVAERMWGPDDRDPRFLSYRVDARPVGATHWSIPIDSSTVAAGDALLARWDTRVVGEGDYDLRLAVFDTLGLMGLAQVTVIVDSAAPWADVTTPARVSALNGGDVHTTNQEIHLYFPPRAFPDDAVVSVTPGDPPPATALPPAAVAVTAGYGIAWSVGPLAKTATLEFALPDSVALRANATPAIYLGHGDEGWTRLGGTFDPERRVTSAPVTDPGRYAIVLDVGSGSGSGGILALELTPRVFSSFGGFAGTSAAISFTLARPASTTVTVFNRAGRRVRNVMSSHLLGAGANLIHWDGRSDGGSLVEDGMYLVAIEAPGEVRKRTVAVVR